MTNPQFARRFYIISLVLLALIAVFDRVVDPFWYYRDIEINGFNQIKPKFRRYERHIKPALLEREQANAIILGSSFSEIGFDPTNPVFTKHNQLRSMNFALAGASWGLVQCSFEFALAHAPIKRVLVGFHPGAMPIVDCQKEFPKLGQISPGELLLSSRAISAAVQTVFEQHENPSHTKEGMYFYIRGQAGIDKQFRAFFSDRVKGKPRCLQAVSTPNLAVTAPASQHDLSGLQRMMASAQAHGVELVLFAYPSHALSLELGLQCGEVQERWQALAQIAGLLEQPYAQTTRVWHFYGYNPWTGEAITSATARYWQDPEHFNFEMGDKLLADMFDNQLPQPLLGHRLSAASSQADYQQFLHGREQYLRQHPEFHGELNKLLGICPETNASC